MCYVINRGHMVDINKACQYNILDFPVNSQLRDQTARILMKVKNSGAVKQSPGARVKRRVRLWAKISLGEKLLLRKKRLSCIL